MKPTVAKYVCGRIDDIVREKKVKISQEYSIPNRKLSERKRFEVITSGKLLFRKDFLEKKRCYAHTNIEEIFDFSDYESYNQYREGYKEALEKLEKEAKKLKDEVWLGDEALAMDILRDFEKY